MAIRQNESRTYYFYNHLINIKNFNINNLKLITKKPQWNVNSINPLYLMINRIKGHFEE